MAPRNTPPEADQSTEFAGDSTVVFHSTAHRKLRAILDSSNPKRHKLLGYRADDALWFVTEIQEVSITTGNVGASMIGIVELNEVDSSDGDLIINKQEEEIPAQDPIIFIRRATAGLVANVVTKSANRQDNTESEHSENKYNLAIRQNGVLYKTVESDLLNIESDSESHDEDEVLSDPNVAEGEGDLPSEPIPPDEPDISEQETSEPLNAPEQPSNSQSQESIAPGQDSASEEFPDFELSTETHELKGLFPWVAEDAFVTLDTGNPGIKLSFEVESLESNVTVYLEYPPDYPESPPHIWFVSPELSEDLSFVIESDTHGDVRVDYVEQDAWSESMTSYDAVRFLMEWLRRNATALRDNQPD